MACGRTTAPGKFRHFVPDPAADYSRGLLHRVERGDTLSAVAAYYQRDAQLLAGLNELRPPYTIYPGEYIYVPPDNTDGIVRNGRLSLAAIRETRRQMAEEDSAAPSGHGRRSKRDVAGDPRLRPVTMASRASAKARMPAERDDGDDPAPAPHLTMGFIWPVRGAFSRGFERAGWRKFHVGVDILAPEGMPIHAAQDGVVIFSGETRDIPAYGRMVVIDHGNGFSTVYAHCSATVARKGRKVRRNEVIARVGATGNATANHLHLELRYNGRALDPMRYLPPFGEPPLVVEKRR